MSLENLPNFSDYIVFVDESGSPTLEPVDPDYPIFILIFCVVKKSDYSHAIQPAFKDLKFKYFGHDMTALHSHAIRKPKGEFSFLQIKELREAFINDLNGIMTSQLYHLIVNIIDKIALKKKYTQPYNPYNIALRMNMEQLTCFLREQGQSQKLCHTIAESRGKKEDNQLELEFRPKIDQIESLGIPKGRIF